MKVRELIELLQKSLATGTDKFVMLEYELRQEGWSFIPEVNLHVVNQNNLRADTRSVTIKLKEH